MKRLEMRTLGYAAWRQKHHLAPDLAVSYVALLILLLAVLVWGSGLKGSFAGLMAPAVALVVLSAVARVAWWFVKYVGPAQTARGQIDRDHERSQRTEGVADWTDIAERAGPSALLRRAHVLRPSLAQLTPAERRRIDPNEVGTLVSTLGFGRLPGQQVWASCEDVILADGAPRVGKTLFLSHKGIHCPGALITTSTRLDLAKNVHEYRKHKPVHIINVAGIRGVPSTVRWSVLSGCRSYTIATERAALLIPEGSIDNNNSIDWVAKARTHLALLLHAAAIGGHRARDIMSWVTAETIDHRHAQRVREILAGSGHGSMERVAAYQAHFAESQGTRKSVVGVLTPGLAWAQDETACPLGDADVNGPDILDIEGIIRNGETLHIIGSENQPAAAPLIAALVSEVVREALTIAGNSPNGRLDPPLTCLLDEIANVCPVPLHKWTSWLGGHNIHMIACVQSQAQLRDVWGDSAASVILGNIATRITFGGGKDAKDLEATSALTGERRMKVVGRDHEHDQDDNIERRGEYRWRPVFTPADAASLPAGQVLVLHRGLRPIIGWAPLVTEVKGWKPGMLPGEPAEEKPVLLPRRQSRLRVLVASATAALSPAAFGARIASGAAVAEPAPEAVEVAQ